MKIKPILYILFIFISYFLFSQDVIKYFNEYFKGEYKSYKLNNKNGNWVISIMLNNTDAGNSYEGVKVVLTSLDVKNYYIKFVESYTDINSQITNFEYTFALYLRENKSPIVAKTNYPPFQSTPNFNFYEKLNNKLVDCSEKLIPKNIYWLFFDEKFSISKLNEKVNRGSYHYNINEIPDTDPMIGGEEDMITYELVIPRTGTETKLLLHLSNRYNELAKRKDFPKDIVYLIKNVKYKEITFSWDYKQGIFRIKSKK